MISRSTSPMAPARSSSTSPPEPGRRRCSQALDIDPTLMPPTFEGPTITGSVTKAAAEATGLRPGTPVVAGGGDQSANAVGVGAVAPGVVALSLGTSGVVFATTARPAIEARRPGPFVLSCESRVDGT